MEEQTANSIVKQRLFLYAAPPLGLCAEERIRTSTPLLAQRPKRCVSAVPPLRLALHILA